MVLGFFELAKEEVPPERYWHSAKRLEEWFEAVDQRRKNPDKPSYLPVDDDQMMDNELTKGLRD